MPTFDGDALRHYPTIYIVYLNIGVIVTNARERIPARHLSVAVHQDWDDADVALEVELLQSFDKPVRNLIK